MAFFNGDWVDVVFAKTKVILTRYGSSHQTGTVMLT